MNPHKEFSSTADITLELKNDEWSLGDLIDYQQYLEEDHLCESNDEKDQHERQLILEQLHTAPDHQNLILSDTPSTRRALFKQWVKLKRQANSRIGQDEAESVGTQVEHLLNGFTGVAVLVAILTAIGVALTLVDPGTSSAIATEDRPYRPLDILHALGFGLLPQVILIVCTVVALCGRKKNWKLPRLFQGLLFLGLRLYTSLMLWLKGHSAVNEATHKLKAQLGKAVGLLLSRKEIFTATLINRLQYVGLAYSATLLITVFIIFTFNARSFGWQSSLNLSPERVHIITDLSSTPWRYFTSDSTPSLEQIRLTEFSEIKGFGTVEKEASKPWIKFLLFSLFVWTVIPRAILSYTTRSWVNSCLGRLDFCDVNDNTLFRRFKTPPFTTTTPDLGPDDDPLPSGRPHETSTSASRPQDTQDQSRKEKYPTTNTPSSTSSRTSRPTQPSTADPKPVTPVTQSQPPRPAPNVVETRGALLVLTDTPEDQLSFVAQTMASKISQLHTYHIHQHFRAYSIHEQKTVENALRTLEWEDGRPKLIIVRRATHLVVAVKSFIERLLAVKGRSTQLVICVGGSPDLFNDGIDPIHVDAWKNYANELKLRFPNVVVEVLGPITAPQA